MTSTSISQQYPQPQPLLKGHAKADRPFLFVLIIMAALATLALLAGRQALRLGDSWQSALTGQASLQIYDIAPENRAIISERIRIRLSDYYPPITADIMDDTEIQKRLKPWLGDLSGETINELPIPLFFSIKSDKEINIDQLQNWLRELALDIEISDHKVEKSRYRDFGKILSRAAFLYLALTLLAAGLISGFATQANMRGFETTLRIMKNAGASRTFVARLFVWRYLKLSLKGAITGTLIGMGLMLVWAIIGGQNIGVISGWRPALYDIIWLIILVWMFTLICTLISGFMAWISPLSIGRS